MNFPDKYCLRMCTRAAKRVGDPDLIILIIFPLADVDEFQTTSDFDVLNPRLGNLSIPPAMKAAYLAETFPAVIIVPLIMKDAAGVKVISALRKEFETVFLPSPYTISLIDGIW